MDTTTKKIGLGTTVLTITALLLWLISRPDILVETSGDIVCKGTSDNPCISYINITSLNKTIYIYNPQHTELGFSPEIKDYRFCKKDARVTSEKTHRGCGAGWRPLNLSQPFYYKYSYVLRFNKGEKNEFKLVGYKKKPTDTIKWGIKAYNQEIDPVWYGIGYDRIYGIGDEIEPFTDVEIIKTGNNITIKRGNGLLVLEPYIITKAGNVYSMKKIKSLYPQITADINLFNHRYYYKFGLNITNIPLAVAPNVAKIGFKRVKSSGITDVTKDGNSLIINNKIRVDFSDVLNLGYNLTINKTDIVIGKINITSDFFYLDPTVEYNMSGTTRKAWDGTLTNNPSLSLKIENLESEFTAAEYVAANKSDNSRATYSFEWAGGYVYAAHRFNFTITEAEADITALNISWEGYGYTSCLADYQSDVYVWNDTAKAWSLFHTDTTSTTDVTLSKKITNAAAIQKVVTATKQIGIMVVAPIIEPDVGCTTDINTDRVFIKVTSTSDNYPTWSNMRRNVTQPKTNRNVQFNITLTDDNGLSWYVFGHNMSGTWNNNTKGKVSGTNVIISVNLTNTATQRKNVSYKWYFNDTNKQWNSSFFGYYKVDIDKNPQYYNRTTYPASSLFLYQKLNTSVKWTDDITLSSCLLSHTFKPTKVKNETCCPIAPNVFRVLYGWNGTTWRGIEYGQSFISNTAGYVENVSLYMLRYFSTRPIKRDVVVQIRENTAENKPSSNKILWQGNISNKSIVVGWKWYNVTSTNKTPAYIQADVKYWMIVSSKDSKAVKVGTTWYYPYTLGERFNAPDYYTRGDGAFNSSEYASWNVYSNRDFLFNVSVFQFKWKNETRRMLNTQSATCLFNITPVWRVDSYWMQYANDSIKQWNHTDAKLHRIITTTEAIPPRGNILSPLNGSFINGNKLIIANVTDNSAVDSCTFRYRNTTISWTNITNCKGLSVSNNLCECSFDTSVLGQIGQGYDVQVVPMDVYGNFNYTTPTRHYYRDSDMPITANLNFIYPSGQTRIHNNQKGKIVVNVTDGSGSGINFTSVNLANLNGSGWIRMKKTSGSTSAGQWSGWELNITVTLIKNGMNFAQLNVTDRSSPKNVLTGDMAVADGDITMPIWDDVGISNPQPYEVGDTLFFYTKWRDNIALDYFIFSNNFTGGWWNSSNKTLELTTQYYSTNRTLMTTVGRKCWKFYGFDTAKNQNQTGLNCFTISSASASGIIVNLVSPPTGNISSVPTKRLQYNITNASSPQACELYLDNDLTLTNLSPYIPQNKTLNFTVTVSPNEYLWYVRCNDTDKTWGYSPTWNFTVTAADTCSLPTNADWVVNCADNCYVNSNAAINPYWIKFYGSGTFTIDSATITVGGVRYWQGCTVRQDHGGKIRYN